jgi:hypothetical protein
MTDADDRQNTMLKLKTIVTLVISTGVVGEWWTEQPLVHPTRP